MCLPCTRTAKDDHGPAGLHRVFPVRQGVIHAQGKGIPLVWFFSPEVLEAPIREAGRDAGPAHELLDTPRSDLCSGVGLLAEAPGFFLFVLTLGALCPKLLVLAWEEVRRVLPMPRACSYTHIFRPEHGHVDSMHGLSPSKP